MLQSQQSLASDSHTRADSTVRPLSRRYLVVLALVAALVLLDQAILQPLLVQLNFSAPAINLAGRQRMLSQKVSKEALAAELAGDGEAPHARRQYLLESLDQWASAHRALLEGDVDRGVQPVDDLAAAAMREIEPAFEAIQLAARQILADNSAPRGGKSPAAMRILELEPTYLRGMERVVAMLEASAHDRVAWLRACGLVAALAIVALLIGVYFFVLQPATQLIRGQVEMLTQARDTLELHINERTAELRTANRALKREMTERQAAELRMRSLSAELAHASRVTALGQLATGLAHEINQPLATVANYAGTLELALDRACPDATEPRQLVSQIKQAALRAGAIVRRMRNFVRRGEVQAAPVDLNVLVSEVTELCRAEFRDAELDVTLELAPQEVLASVDAVQIQQVLVNLFHNAIQAMADSPVRALEVRTECGPNEVTVEVYDSGPGLPVEIIQRCFQPFHSSKREGLGLGLAISRNIIEQHQGRIWSENRECGGAVVGFSLPCLHAHDITSEQLVHGIRG
jgi:two-component system sensor kinase FixL